MRRTITSINRIKLFTETVTGIMFLLAGCTCDMLKATEVNTHRDISDGLRRGNSLYFLCDYVLSGPGYTIIPMYAYKQGKIYYDAVHLYSLDSEKSGLARLASLKPTSSHRGRGSVKDARWATMGSSIYVLYRTGWSSANDGVYELFLFDSTERLAREITGDEKSSLLERLFVTKGRRPGLGRDVIPASRVRYRLAGMDDEAWQLPLPADYADLNEKQCERILIEQRGDTSFRRAALRNILPSLSEEKARGIIAAMENYKSNLSGYKQKIYSPLLEEWSARIAILARYKNAASAGEKIRRTTAGFADADGRTALMVAAYFNDTSLLDTLIRAGAAIDARDAYGCTPLMYAIFGTAPDAMEYFLKKGADTKTSSASGWTAWMFVSGSDLREGYLRLTGK